MRTLRETKPATAFLDSVKTPKHKAQLEAKIEGLCRNPFPGDCKKMSDRIDRYRVDCGEYRIVYRVSVEYIDVLIVGKRNDGEVYKQEKRL